MLRFFCFVKSYYRYGRDYYVKAAANAAGTRKKLKNDYNDDAVSPDDSLAELESGYVRANINRRLFKTKNDSTINFVKNPLLNFPDEYKIL